MLTQNINEELDIKSNVWLVKEFGEELCFACQAVWLNKITINNNSFLIDGKIVLM